MTGKERKHSYTGASSCERWVNCPASVQLHKQVGGSPTNCYAAEGTKAHNMAEYALKYYLSVKKSGFMQGWLGNVENVEGHDIAVTQEMIDAVRLYAETICEDMYYDDLTNRLDGIDCPKQQHLHIEEHVNLGFGNCYGTVDAYYYTEDALYVYDFKYGKGIDVDPENNMQMMFYALGALRNTNCLPDNVVLTIVQPRSPLGNQIKRWYTDSGRLHDFEKMLLAAIEEIETGGEIYKTDEKWCRWCPGKLICPELRKTMHETAKADFCDLIEPGQKDSVLDVKRMSNTELSALLKNEKLIKDFLSSGKDEAYKRLEQGEDVPGFELISKQGNRVWNDKAEKVLYEQHGDAIYTPQKMLTPAQAEKQLKVKNIDELTTRPNSLAVASSEKKHNKAIQEFKDVF
jgi:hypothetical protein